MQQQKNTVFFENHLLRFKNLRSVARRCEGLERGCTFLLVRHVYLSKRLKCVLFGLFPATNVAFNYRTLTVSVVL
jgi:hypothetical protein